MEHVGQKQSPCLSCQRVRDPANCENKLCNEWRSWWIGRWECMRMTVKAIANGRGIQGNPISVGGTKYHHPDRTRDFLLVDPCLQCPWRDGLCQSTCDTKQIWIETKERSNELESGSSRQAEKV